ncbi:unnamed protein product, partial [marine sediment metagenome]
MKICIPSKDRAEDITTHLFFDNNDVFVFVDSDEVKKYKIFNPDINIIDVKSNRKGISHCLNFILYFVKDDKYIVASDDIFFFGKRNDEYRYDELRNPKEITDIVSIGLDKYTLYGIAENNFLYHTNKQTDNALRFNVNCKTAKDFYGVNRKKLNELNIKYDEDLIIAEDEDLNARVMLKNSKVCVDQGYCINSKSRQKGGISWIRKFAAASKDSSLRQSTGKLAEKYGVEFVSFSY